MTVATKWGRVLLGALFTLALVLTMVPALSQTALADPDGRTEITSASATSDVDAVPTFGHTIKNPTFSMDTGLPASVMTDGLSSWQKYNETTGVWEDVFTGTFTEGQWRYQVALRLEASDATNYKFSEGVTFEVNGVAWTQNGIYGIYDPELPSGNWANAWFYSPTFTVDASSSVTEIDSVNLYNIPYPVIGTVPSGEGVLTDTEGVKVDAANTQWGYIDGGYWVVNGNEPVRADREYQLRVAIEPTPGFGFADSLTATSDMGAVASIEPCGADGEFRFVYCPVSIVEPISTSNVYVVTAGSLNVREAASTDSKRLGGLHYGDVIESTGEYDNWVRFEFEGKDAWVNRSYLALTYDVGSTIAPVEYTVDVGALTVREAPSTEATRIGGVKNEDVLLVTGKVKDTNNDQWLVIEYPGEDGPQVGFVMGQYTSAVSAEEDTDSTIIKFSAVPHGLTDAGLVWARIAVGDNADLIDENVLDNGDGTYTVTVFPDDAMNYSAISADDVQLPSDSGLVVRSLTLNADGAVEIVLGPEETVTYTFSAGGNGSWTKGSGAGFDLTVNRSVDDDTTFSHFTGITVDGTALDASAYTAASGSLNATISSDYLDTLSAGDHALAVEFDDGTAETTLTVAEETSGSDDNGSSDNGGSGNSTTGGSDNGSSSGSTAGTSNSGSSSSNAATGSSTANQNQGKPNAHPRTSDETNLILLVGLFIAAASAIGTAVFLRRNRA